MVVMPDTASDCRRPTTPPKSHPGNFDTVSPIRDVKATANTVIAIKVIGTVIEAIVRG
jgi:hypothetical protein